MILTVTPNPSLDLLFASDAELSWDDANRVAEPRRRPGGQGINVTRAALALGGSSHAVALLGGRTGDTLAQDLQSEGTPLRRVAIRGETRTFVAVRETSTGRSLLVNSRGPACDAADGERLLAAVSEVMRASRPRWVVSSGSVPPGIEPDLHRRIGECAQAAGVRFIADCDGVALACAARAGVCDVLVPNRHEALRLAGTDPHDPAAAAAVARGLLSHAPAIAIKLGELGAVAADANGAWHALPPALSSGSAVGAGDAFLAAFLIATDSGAVLPDALADAVATGTAVLRSAGSSLVDPAAVRITRAAVRVSRVG